jgi:hypothetical protein
MGLVAVSVIVALVALVTPGESCCVFFVSVAVMPFANVLCEARAGASVQVTAPLAFFFLEWRFEKVTRLTLSSSSQEPARI